MHGTNLLSQLDYPTSSQFDNTKLTQSKICQWAIHRAPPNSEFDDTRSPDRNCFGTPLMDIGPQTTPWILMQNPQYSLQANFESEELINSFKRPFSKQFQQIHLSATSCDIGLTKNYKNRYNLTGGVAIIATGQWVSKVHSTQQDPRGHGSFTVTTLHGRHGKLLSIVAACISVEKGTNSTTFMHSKIHHLVRSAKKQTIYSKQSLPSKILFSNSLMQTMPLSF